MPDIVHLGPLMVASDRLVAVALIWLFLAVGERLSPRTGTRAERAVIWIAVVVGLLAARIGFIARNHAAYAPHPWAMAAVWQGGFSPWAGIFGAAIAIIAILGRRRETARLLTMLGALTLINGAMTPLLRQPPRPLAAPLMLMTLDGRPVDVGSLRGRPFVINLWATWCPPCRREMPMLIDVAATSTMPILLVNEGEPADRVAGFLRSQRLDSRMIRLDPTGDLGRATGSPALPTTLFIDAGWRIRQTHVGEISRAALLVGMRDLENDPR